MIFEIEPDGKVVNITNRPWSKRASVTARRTYSAESKIVYKRRKHMMTMQDAKRIMDKLMLLQQTERTPARGFWVPLMRWLRQATLDMLEFMIPAKYEFAIEPVYDLINDAGNIILGDLGIAPEQKVTLEQAFTAYKTALREALKGSWTNRGD